MADLSIIIPWCDRPELGRTLRHNRSEFSASDGEVLVVNCGGDKTALGPLLANLAIPQLRIVSISDCRFNKSLALNLGAHFACGGNLFFLDADILLPPGALATIRAALCASSFVTIERVVESKPKHQIQGSYIQEFAHRLEFTRKTGPSVILEVNRVRFADGSRGAPGLVLLARDDFRRVNGMNSRLEGWGWEDLDLVARLQLGLGLRRVIAGSVTHLTHGDASRARAVGGKGRGKSDHMNFSRCLRNYASGNLLGTYKEDVAIWSGKATCENVEDHAKKFCQSTSAGQDLDTREAAEQSVSEMRHERPAAGRLPRSAMKAASIPTRLACVSDFLHLAKQFAFVGGWLDPIEGYALHLLALDGPGLGEIVEIGSYLGRSTAFLASGSKKSAREKVTAVDHFQGSPEHQPGQQVESDVLKQQGTTFELFLSNIKRLELDDYVTPVVARSEDAARSWQKPIRLLFIDGDHSYEESKKDFTLWSKFVVVSGLVCFHDIHHWPGVTQFYEELMPSSKDFREIATVRSLKVIQRVR